MHLTLFVPELLWPEPDDHPPAGHDLPMLGRLLARGRLRRGAAQSAEDALAALCGWQPAAPLGALRRLGEAASPEPDGARWLCADPVHLRFEDERLLLAGGAPLQLGADEAESLVAALNAALPEWGHFHAAAPDRWYLSPNEAALPEPLSIPTLSSVAGRHVGQVLPDALDDRRWRRCFNDVQTVLHAAPANRHRENAGRMTVNGLWLWGDGRLAAASPPAFATIRGGLPLARGLGRSGGAAVILESRPDTAATLLEQTAAGGAHLVVLDDLADAVHYDEAARWSATLARLERDWFAPLVAALQTGRIGALDLVATTAYGRLHWSLRRAGLWQFWRPAQPLPGLAAQLAKEER